MAHSDKTVYFPFRIVADENGDICVLSDGEEQVPLGYMSPDEAAAMAITLIQTAKVVRYMKEHDTSFQEATAAVGDYDGIELPVSSGMEHSGSMCSHFDTDAAKRLHYAINKVRRPSTRSRFIRQVRRGDRRR